MATATRKRTSKKSATVAQSTIVKLNVEALKTTEALIEGTIETSAKYQNLYAKSLKKSEPIIAKNINLAFNTAETVVEQYQKSSKRVLALFGWDVKEVKKATQKEISTARKATKPASNIMKKATETAKKALSSINTETKTATQPAAKKVSQPVAKTVTNKTKKTTTTATKKIAVVKKTATKATAITKTASTKVVSKTDSTNLTLINGVGPKMEALLKKEGYSNLEAIAKATVADLKKVLDNADARYRLLNPQSWVKDAQKALK